MRTLKLFLLAIALMAAVSSLSSARPAGKTKSKHRTVTKVTTKCVVTGEDRTGILLSCNDAQKSELRIPIGEWPREWHGPELGFAYEVDAKGQPVPTDREAWHQRMAAIRARQLEMLRLARNR